MLFLLAVILFAGYTTYCAIQTNSKLANLSLNSVESLARGEDEKDDMNDGETSNNIWVGYVNKTENCTIKETYECKIGFTIPDWVPWLGGMSCEFDYIDEVDFPGTRNECIYTGNSNQRCDYYRCTKN